MLRAIGQSFIGVFTFLGTVLVALVCLGVVVFLVLFFPALLGDIVVAHIGSNGLGLLTWIGSFVIILTIGNFLVQSFRRS